MPIYRDANDSRSAGRSPCVPLKLMPYPLVNPEECITDLDPKSLVDFPSQECYPAPQGEKDGDTPCGCLYTDWGDCRLETIWQPVWCLKSETPVTEHTSKLTGGREWTAHHRFEVWSIRDSDRESYPNAGGFTWPDKYHAWEVEVTFGDEKARDLEGSLTFRIGEKDHLNVPLDGMFRRPTRPRSLVAPLPIPLFIPSVQHFMGEITWRHIPDDWRYRDLGRVRLQLNGYRHRSIP